MVVGLIIGVAVIVAAIFAWRAGIAAGASARIRIGSIEARKDRAIRQGHREAQATRNRILEASRQRTRSDLDGWLRQTRRRRNRRLVWGITSLVALCIAVIVLTIALPSSPQVASGTPGASSQTSLDAVIAALAKGKCTNFTNDYQTDALPVDPAVVSCSNSHAAFKVAWLGSPADASCPGKYSELASWTSSSGLTACMERVYQAGQCMQGEYEKGYSYSWTDDAVVPCSSRTTSEYPYLVVITGIHGIHYESCDSGYWKPSDQGNRHEITVCVRLKSDYFHRGRH